MQVTGFRCLLLLDICDYCVFAVSLDAGERYLLDTCDYCVSAVWLGAGDSRHHPRVPGVAGSVPHRGAGEKPGNWRYHLPVFISR